MILKTPHGPSHSVFFLTQDMYDVLKDQSIPLEDMKKIASYHKRLSYGEIAGLLKFQYAVAKRLQVIMTDPTPLFGEGYDGKMVESAFNALDSETLITSVYDKTEQFSMLNAGGNVLLILFQNRDDKVPGGWDPVNAKTFSGALLEMAYAKVGYLESHQGEVVKAKAGECSFAEIFKLLETENTGI
jgi:hypothetical protein